MIEVLVVLSNIVRFSVSVPVGCRVGMQVSLFNKGMVSCPLDLNNYWGITLLSAFDKIPEIVIWERVETWWKEQQVISELQGACKKGLSCIHTAMPLQETITMSLETNRKFLVPGGLY